MTVGNNLPQDVPTGTDPSGSKTSEALSREVSARVVAERLEIDRALVNKSLPIAQREGLPPALAKEIVEFNRRVGDFHARQEALAEARINLPMVLADAKFCGADLVKRTQKIRGERYDVLRLHAKLLAARKTLLETLIEHIDKNCIAAEGRAQAAAEKVAKALKDAGYVPRPARGVPGQYPLAEQRAFDYEVTNQPVVRAAAEEAKAIRVELAEIRRQADGVDVDVAFLEDLIAGAWRALVGANT